MNLDRATLEVLHRIKVDPAMEPFRKYLERRRDEARERLENVHDVHQMLRMQGSAIEVRQIIEDIQTATQLLEGASRKPVTGRPALVRQHSPYA